MFPKGASRTVPRGSWAWTLKVAERTAFATIALEFVVVHLATLPRALYFQGLALVGAQLVGTWFLFRAILPRGGEGGRTIWAALGIGGAMTLSTFALFHGAIPSVHLFFLPWIVIAGLLGGLTAATISTAVSIAGYLILAEIVGAAPPLLGALLNSILFVFSGSVAGLLSQELRSHYARELQQQRRATSFGYRLSAVVDAVEEALVFTDSQGTIRMINRRAIELFGIDAEEHIAAPGVQLARVIARMTEDPEGFMEALQALRDDPLAELAQDVEQIIPERRALRLLSRAVLDDSGLRVGRIDVYVDVSETTRRAEEMERLYREARQTAESYQRALLPSTTPNLPRITLVAHYIPAAGTRAVCGDFYDFLTMPNGSVGLVMGDVCGVGPSAVNDAALTRYTISSRARAENDPGRLLELTNKHAHARMGMERFVRVFIATLDPERGVLEYANAGHVPPLVFRASSGKVEWLEEGGLPLGVEADAEFKTARVELEPGDSVFLYTDGVNEAPRAGRPFGQGRLSDLVKHYGYGTPGEMLQGIRRSVESWLDGDMRDDLAMVGCQVVPDAAVDESMRELVLPNEPARIRDVRAFVSQFLNDLRASVDSASDLIVAASEAASNAAKYGQRSEGRSELRVRCILAGTDAVVTVVDDGGGFDVGDDIEGLPDPLAIGGRGMFLMKELTDSMSIDPTPYGTTVVLRREAFTEGRSDVDEG